MTCTQLGLCAPSLLSLRCAWSTLAVRRLASPPQNPELGTDGRLLSSQNAKISRHAAVSNTASAEVDAPVPNRVLPLHAVGLPPL